MTLSPRNTSRLVLALVTIICIALGRPVLGQDGESEITLKELQAPASPAFVLLDIEPTSIQRPKTPKALTISILSTMGGSDNLIPENYSVEFAPYWLSNHPNLAYDQYLKGVGRTFLQTLSLSLATTTTDMEGMEAEGIASTTRLGFGFRGQFVGGRNAVDKAHNAKLAALEKADGTLLDLKDLLEKKSRQERTRDLLSDRSCWLDLQGQLLELEDADLPAIYTIAETEKREKEETLPELRAQLEKLKTELKRLEADSQTPRTPEQEKARTDKGKEIEKKNGEIDKVERAVRCRSNEIYLLDPYIGAHTLEVLMRTEVLASALDQEIQKIRDEEARVKSAHDKAVAAVEKATRAIGDALGAFGFTLDFAAAGVWQFAGESKDNSEFEKWGVWLTPAYRFERKDDDGEGTGKPLVEFLGVGRYIEDDIAQEHAWDLGFRFIYNAGDDFSISGEMLERDGAEMVGDGSRWTIVAEYRASKEAYLVASYGSNFPKAGSDGELISTLGIRFAFGKEPTLLEPVQKTP